MSSSRSHLLPLIIAIVMLIKSDIECRSTNGSYQVSDARSNIGNTGDEKQLAQNVIHKLIVDKQTKLQQLSNKLISNDTNAIDEAIMLSMLEGFLQYFQLAKGDPETVAIVEYLMQMSKGRVKILPKEYGLIEVNNDNDFDEEEEDSNDDDDDDDDDDWLVGSDDNDWSNEANGGDDYMELDDNGGDYVNGDDALDSNDEIKRNKTISSSRTKTSLAQ